MTWVTLLPVAPGKHAEIRQLSSDSVRVGTYFEDEGLTNNYLDQIRQEVKHPFRKICHFVKILTKFGGNSAEIGPK